MIISDFCSMKNEKVITYEFSQAKSTVVSGIFPPIPAYQDWQDKIQYAGYNGTEGAYSTTTFITFTSSPCTTLTT